MSDVQSITCRSGQKRVNNSEQNDFEIQTFICLYEQERFYNRETNSAIFFV